jgi:glycosyltransferase involved in cell wall biosynthesis
MRLVFWQNMLSHHQSAHIRALASRPSVDVTIVGLAAMTPERQALGWSVPNFGNAAVVEAPAAEEIPQLVSGAAPEAIHLVAGWRGLQHGDLLMRALRTSKVRYGLLAEGGDGEGWRGWSRRALYRTDRIVRGRCFDFIIAMGEQGVAWFRGLGYPTARLFPYAYLLDQPPESHCDGVPNGPVRIFYIGRCVERKGMDVALRALAQFPHLDWQLTILGSGEAIEPWGILADSLGIGGRVRYLPAMPNPKVLVHLGEADLLILPSRFDGWGAVVNEALMSGVPVICSDRCGAKDLLKESWRGGVFPSDSHEELAVFLADWLPRGRRPATERERIRNWAGCLSGERGADYLLRIFNHLYEGGERPLPPWVAAA